MPIKPENKHLYPEDWPERSAARIEKAGHRCELCGVKNKTWIQRHKQTPAVFKVCKLDQNNKPIPSKSNIWEAPKKIVLTVAHMDPSYNLDDIDSLLATCQRCHFTIDRVTNKVESQGMVYVLAPAASCVPASWAANPKARKCGGA